MSRVDPPHIADERTLMSAFLDYQRSTFMWKIAGLTTLELHQAAPPSTLTLGGLTKHLALVEDHWFQERFLGRADIEPWASAPFEEDADWDFHSAQHDEGDALVELYTAACDRSRAVVADAESLDDVSATIDTRSGSATSLRWILLHMIEETARHNGHADLLREAIDGETGM
jgi:uncharacterized damage-inducible protein DinB